MISNLVFMGWIALAYSPLAVLTWWLCWPLVVLLRDGDEDS
jgi:hypothetical protein